MSLSTAHEEDASSLDDLFPPSEEPLLQHEDLLPELESAQYEPKIIEDDAKTPKIGMKFKSYDEVCSFYAEYALDKGFAIMRRSSKTDDDGVLRYVTVACARSGMPRNSNINPNRGRSSIKIGCKAKINATLGEDGLFFLSFVETNHNHLISPSKVRFYRANKHIDAYAKKRLELNDQAGIPFSKNFNSLVVEAGEYDNLSFGEREGRNHVDKARRLKLGEGDAEAIRKYFVRMHKKNPQFYHSMDIDDDGHLRNVFWADARSRAAYESFSDVVVFDTTYLTNKYEMPFAPFVGVNHHGQSILLGCGLICSEKIDNFVWLFEEWLDCMSGQHPGAIITDQCQSIRGGIAKVFPNTLHCLCRWHIMKKTTDKFGSYSEYDVIVHDLQSCLHECLTPSEFEVRWSTMIAKHGLEENEWLKSLYNERNRWVPCFTRKHFLAGMSSSQRSESMNSFFDDYIKSHTSLKQFVEQYEKAMKKKVEKESKADFDSFNSNLRLVSNYYMESQLRKIYTTDVFRIFQKEIRHLIYCTPEMVREEHSMLVFEVTDRKEIVDEDGKVRKELKYVVTFDPIKLSVQCTCHYFEFRGILCRHALSVLLKQQVNEIPHQYILSRWRKDIKRPHNFVKCFYDELGDIDRTVRYNKLNVIFSQVIDIGLESEYLCERANFYISEVVNKLIEEKIAVENQAKLLVTDDAGTSYKRVWSPLKVKRKGRPPEKRKMGRPEKVQTKQKAKCTKRKKFDGKKEMVPTKKKEKCSRKNKPEGDKEMVTSDSNANGKEQVQLTMQNLNINHPPKDQYEPYGQSELDSTGDGVSFRLLDSSGDGV